MIQRGVERRRQRKRTEQDRRPSDEQGGEVDPAAPTEADPAAPAEAETPPSTEADAAAPAEAETPPSTEAEAPPAAQPATPPAHAPTPVARGAAEGRRALFAEITMDVSDRTNMSNREIGLCAVDLRITHNPGTPFEHNLDPFCEGAVPLLMHLSGLLEHAATPQPGPQEYPVDERFLKKHVDWVLWVPIYDGRSRAHAVLGVFLLAEPRDDGDRSQLGDLGRELRQRYDHRIDALLES